MKELIDAFQSFRKILCICPCCGEIVRVSDLHLQYKGKAAKTWLDNYELDVISLNGKEEEFDEKENELREKSIERGRNKVPILVRNCLCSDFRTLKYDPYDMKAVMHPVDFVVFDGLNEGEEVRNVTFLTRTPNSIMRPVIESLKSTVKKGSYDWKVARVTTAGKVDFE
jgi:predicted Holliday junction resolvase-like endonuclease